MGEFAAVFYAYTQLLTKFAGVFCIKPPPKILGVINLALKTAATAAFNTNSTFTVLAAVFNPNSDSCIKNKTIASNKRLLKMYWRVIGDQLNVASYRTHIHKYECMDNVFNATL